MTHVLEMNAAEIGKVFLAVFVAGIPGSKLGGMVGVVLNPLRSAMLCLIIFVINTTLAALTLTGPESKNAMYGFAALCGAFAFHGCIPPMQVCTVQSHQGGRNMS